MVRSASAEYEKFEYVEIEDDELGKLPRQFPNGPLNLASWPAPVRITHSIGDITCSVSQDIVGSTPVPVFNRVT